MTYEHEDRKLNGFFRLTDDFASIYGLSELSPNLIHIIWNRNQKPVALELDGLNIELKPQQLTTITNLQRVDFSNSQLPITAYSFNREFYCIQTNDSEVSCNGIIFFGTQDLPIITLDDYETEMFELLYRIFIEEFGNKDNVQDEMLRMLLKRLIIKTTRLAKVQHITRELGNTQLDIVRKYNVLVDTNFKKLKHVADYARLLNKSPKTLSNLFGTYNQKSPLRIIHERIILEARRLLVYTDSSIKEIAYELGFEEVSHFNKMFKKIMGNSPSEFKRSLADSGIGKKV
jgi:AraC-like DNA-binding protein